MGAVLLVGFALMRRVMRCSWLIIGVAGALAPTVGAATTTSTTRVTVSDVGVDPTAACVRKGGKVLWVNNGARSHRITADQRTWPAFTLAAGKSKSITFPRIGTHPYRLDGTPVGVVNVRTTCSGPAGGTDGTTPGTGATTPGTGSVPVAPGTRFVTYDVEARGSLIQKGTAMNAGRLAYQLDRTLTWSATFSRVRIEVRDLPNGGWLANLGPGLSVEATERFTIQSRVLYQSGFNPPPPPLICTADVSLVLPAKLYVAGVGVSAATGSSFVVGAGLTDGGADALKAAERAQYDPDCDLSAPTDSVGADFDLGNLMTARLYLQGYTPTFARIGGPSKAPPADALLRGEAFRLTVGPRTSTDSCFGDVCSEEEYYIITFTPVR